LASSVAGGAVWGSFHFPTATSSST
jgi:hypothetical protein